MHPNKEKTQARAIAFAVLAAALYALSTPFSKLLLDKLKPSMMAALLYLGAGVGMSLVNLLARRSSFLMNEQPLDLKEWPSIAGMILLDVAAPILLMIGLSKTTAENASLFNNFEIVATGLIAFIFFREAISKRSMVGNRAGHHGLCAAFAGRCWPQLEFLYRFYLHPISQPVLGARK